MIDKSLSTIATLIACTLPIGCGGTSSSSAPETAEGADDASEAKMDALEAEYEAEEEEAEVEEEAYDEME
jgi:hypothetical protein